MFRTLIYIPFVNILVALIAFTPGHSAAFAIILFTLLIRLILLIPNRHALENQKKMQALQPEIDQLRKTYKDQQEQAKALMELYHKNQISPFGSCLPLLIQLPILIILFRILQSGFGADTLSVLYSFVPQPAFINNNFFGIDISLPDPTLILPVLATGSQLLQTVSMMAVSRKQGQKMPGQGMFIVFSLMTFVIAKQVNAGVVLYWITSTIFGLGQQIIVNKNKIKLVHADELTTPTNHHHDKHHNLTATKTSATKTSAREEKSQKRGIQITVRRPGKGSK